MKALRVLTGIHAGAQIRLTVGSYRLGGAEDADICISDWQVGELVLTLGEDGVTRLCLDGGEEVLVPDFVAVPYGDVVFCVGPDDVAWPRDLDLLAPLWQTAEPDAQAVQAEEHADAQEQEQGHGQKAAQQPEPELPDREPLLPSLPLLPLPRAKALRTAGVALACTVLIVALSTAGVLMAGSQSTEAANVKFDPDATSRQLAGALHRAGLNELTVKPRGAQLVVRGIVRTADDSDSARRIMDQLARGKALREYDVAQQDAVNIQQSLGDTGAHVEYKGNGVFLVSGTVSSMKKFRALLANVKPDLDANIRRLDVDVKEARSTIPDVRYSEVVSVGGLRYIETPDGTKHLLDTGGDSTDSGNKRID
ncbi:secretion protein SctD [Paraburkholderia caffeinilytica]|uniref:secretion protein SctD n=1 Tax=Paraburkholderia caffeinilytica TaxID=1761016 RepID=UPI003DA13D58